MQIDPELLKRLKKESNEFRKLYDEHIRLKERVETLNNMKFLSPEQELEKKTIQKQKLKSKDRLTKIIDQFCSAAS